MLAELDVRKNVKLDYLNCRGNSLKQLDLSSNVNLTYLSCFKNNLTELDLSKNAKLSVASPSIDEQAITDTKAVLKRSGNGYVLNMNELVPGIDLTRVTRRWKMPSLVSRPFPKPRRRCFKMAAAAC